jgi:hypothetical protein
VIRVGGPRSIPNVGSSSPTTARLQHHRFLIPIPPKRLDRHRIEHSKQTLNTANHKTDQHKTMVGDAHPTRLERSEQPNQMVDFLKS